VSHAGDSAPFGTIDLSTFFATEVEGLADGFYNYIGSLTTPPCSEAVYWWVAQNHATMTAEQYNALKAVMGFSARHTLSRGYFK
jgi:carbonic anhydrase